MGQNRFKLLVYWNTREEGGRAIPPGKIYIGDIDIDGDSVTHRWCFRITMSHSPILGEKIEAIGEFLLDSSPFHLMHQGRKLEFYEGNKLVAQGELM